MLTDRLFLIQTENGLITANLPEVLALLCASKLLGFDGLTAHQRPGWDLFLWQIAAMALAAVGESTPPADEAAWRNLADADAWRDRLAGLTPGCATTAWSLIVDDLTQPAFLQPPIRSGSLAGYSLAGETPDEIDVLVTSKGHDVKAARAANAELRHWVFALCALQTQQGYSGRGHFGIARMNGGFASRPMVMLTPSRDAPVRFRRGVQAALAARAAALDERSGYYREDGLKLLWLESWDTDVGLFLNDLDPLFVEVCRRIRLVQDAAGRVTALSRPSDAARVDVPKDAKGDLGDAWTPISQKEGAALTVAAAGFDYRLISRLIATSEFKRPAAMEPQPDDRGPLWLHAAVLARGQGKTEGFHERWLRLPSRAHDAFSDPAASQAIGRFNEAMIADASAAKKALQRALQAFLQGGPEKIDFKDDRPKPWLDRLEDYIDSVFFDHLFASVQAHEDPAEPTQAWKRALVTHTRALFAQAADQLSPPQARREKASAFASLLLGRELRKAKLIMPGDGDAAEDES